MCASLKGHTEIVEVLMAAGANVEAMSKVGLVGLVGKVV